MSDRVRRCRNRERGFTLVELGMSVALLASIATAGGYAVIQIQGAFVENELVAQAGVRAQESLERVVAILSRAVTSDAEFGVPYVAKNGGGSGDANSMDNSLVDAVDTTTRTVVNTITQLVGGILTTTPQTTLETETKATLVRAVTFRVIQAFDHGIAVYDDDNKVWIYGTTDGVFPCDGLIIGRGPSLQSVSDKGAGDDDRLGTEDDDTSVKASVGSEYPAVELLLSGRYAPKTGKMFQVQLNGRVLTVYLRVNVRRPDGSFVLDEDMVLEERVALRQ